MSWEKSIEELRRRERLAEKMGGEEPVERQRGRGKLTVRERVAFLADPGSFHEIGKIAGKATYGADEALEASPAFEAIRAEQVRHESPFLVAALQAFATGRASLGASDPLDLTEDVRARLAAAAGG